MSLPYKSYVGERSKSRRTARWLRLLLTCFLFLGCGDASSYQLDLRFHTTELRNSVTEIQVSIRKKCEDLEPIEGREITLVKGDPNPPKLRGVDDGRYAIVAIGYTVDGDQRCEVARGCKSETLERGGTKTILVELTDIPEPICTTITRDGSVPDATVDADDDAGHVTDATQDADEPESDAYRCTPTTEVCNEMDDDCDRAVDEDVIVDADPENCGECGNPCDDGLACAGAQCVAPAIQIAPGTLHTCALRGDGQVLCWGGNPDGELATGDIEERLSATVVPDLANVRQISSGKYHVCALRDAGEIVCWGDNGWKQLAETAGGDQTRPVVIGGVGTAQSLGLGSHHSCVVLEGGDVMCWGWNGMGQVGVPFVDRTTLQATPVAVPDLHDVAQVDGGCSYTCARHTNGTVSCWGANDKGQLGDGTFAYRVAAAPIESASGDPITNVIGLAVGCEQSCIVQEGTTVGEGTVLCWGVNTDGSVGIGTFSAAVKNPASTGITDALEVAAGNPFSCARRTNGIGLCWGFNNMGQLGDGSMMTRSQPTPVSTLTDATSLYVDNGDLHSCAIRSDQSVVCWGANTYGQLGTGAKSSSAELVPVRVRGI